MGNLQTAMQSTAPQTRSGTDSQVLTQRDAIRQSLKIFRDHRATLSINFELMQDEFHCKILDVLERAVLLEDIQPRSGSTHFRDGISFSLSARASGYFAYADQLRVISAEAERGVPYYLAPLPESMLLQRRRRADRYKLPMTVSTAGARITIERKPTLEGDLLDVSVGGCRAEFPASATAPFKEQEELRNWRIEIQRTLDLQGTAVVRHIAQHPKKHTWIAGLELTDLNVTDRRRLEQFVQSLARQAG